jgi:Flp pilus assembly protein TadD
VVVGRIIRTCSFAVSLAILATPANAKVTSDSALSLYAQARVADAAGDDLRALQGYAAALTSAPENDQVAQRALRQAVRLGDKALAVRAARVLERQKSLPADARLLLLSEAFSKGDWRGAELQLDAIDENSTFAFLTPSLRGWLAYASGNGDVAVALAGGPKIAFGANYASEQKLLLLAALKRNAALVDALSENQADDWTRLMIGSGLVRAKLPQVAESVLAGDGRMLAQARALVSKPAALPAPVSKPAQAQAVMLARLASDLLRDNAGPIALSIARLAMMADSSQPVVLDSLVRVLQQAGDHDAALAAADRLSALPLQQSRAADLKFEILSLAGRNDEVLALARAMLNGNEAVPSLHLRLATALAGKRDHQGAADAIRKAITLVESKDGGPASWSVWLALGRELDAAGNWPEAKMALVRAVDLGPNQPTPLNHLGYTMLIRGEPIDQATKLIARASALRPTDAAITDSLGFALLKSGKFEEAVTMLERAYATEPTEPEIADHLGDAYWSAGRRIEARYVWQAALVQAGEKDKARLLDKIDFGLRATR